MDIGNYIKENLPKAPAGIDEWIYRKCAERVYIIYSNKEDRAICTSCGEEFRTYGEFRHNDEMECPCCGEGAILKASGIGRKKITDSFRIMICIRKGKTVWLSVYETYLEYGNFGRPNIYKKLKDVFTINSKEQHHYKRDYVWQLGTWKWDEAKSMNLPHVMGGSQYWYQPPLNTVYVFKDNLQAVFEKSDLKYLWLPDLIAGMNAYELTKYMADGARFQSIELLAKAGFRNLVWHRIRRFNGLNNMNWRGKTLEKILRASKGDVRKLRTWDVNMSELVAFQKLDREDRNRLDSKEALTCLSKLYEAGEIGQYCSVLDFAEYQAAGDNIHVSSWLDYIHWAQKFDLDITKRKVLFPKNFWIEHDRLMADIQEEKDKEVAAKIKQAVEAVKGYSYETDHLIIKPATTQKMLTNESSQLNHCVRTYGPKLANGRCFIFFVREKEHPRKSYYTLETGPDGSFVQCRGKSNCDMTDEVKKFVTGFTEYLQKQMKKERRTA